MSAQRIKSLTNAQTGELQPAFVGTRSIAADPDWIRRLPPSWASILPPDGSLGMIDF